MQTRGAQDHREQLKRLLDRVTGDPNREARWLNTLSFLEFVGARKIAAFMGGRYPDLQVLEHWADETRHALVLRQTASLVESSGTGCLSLLGLRSPRAARPATLAQA